MTDPAKRVSAEDALRHRWINAPLTRDASLHLTRENMRRTLNKRRFKVRPRTLNPKPSDPFGETMPA